MRRTLLSITMMTANLFAVEKQELMPLIETASTVKSNAYLEVRNKILEYGTSIIPILGSVAVDDTLPWQQRLVARICYERIERKNDIEKLLATDWYSHPKFNPNEHPYIMGPEAGMGGIVVSDLKEVALWYYYLELEWKITGEEGRISKHHFPDLWVSWCTLAVRDNPEERIWFLRICSEIMAIDPPTQRWSRWLFPTLRREEKPDTVYLLEHRAPPPLPEEPPFRLGTKIIKPAK